MQVTERLRILETLVLRPKPCSNNFGTSGFRLELAISAVKMIVAMPTDIANAPHARSGVFPSFSIHVVSPDASGYELSRGLRFNERVGCFDFPKNMIISQS